MDQIPSPNFLIIGAAKAATTSLSTLLESAYVEHMATPGGGVFSSINDAVRRMPMIIDSSRYWEVFDAYRNAFHESRIKIVWFEEYIANQVAVFQDVCRFLMIDDTVLPDLAEEQANSREWAQSRMNTLGRGHIEINTVWDEEVRKRVIDELRADNIRILDHSGKPRDYWGDLFD